ncbi:RNA polymerase sigma factor [Bordetella petrii]|uniref:RNA polymerase sigma factor n=1 Tax=Bordetella petrii TaxID=94624 RepID=UPI001E2E121D|nr:RNA polymerase sigma factor [Bordetella petrii]MCD0506268.1 RNA polymerase sigma factor [Bordetella petrii]
MDIPGADDETLMQAYGAAGNMAAFDALYARHRGGLYRYILRSARNPHLADDIFQETWSRVIDARARWQPHAKFTTWLLQIAHNLLIDAHRRQPAQASPQEADAALARLAVAEHEQPEQQLSEFQTRRRLQLAIERLPDEQRHAMLLRLEHDLSLEEIAEVTGAPRETVKSRLRYATQRIREELGA